MTCTPQCHGCAYKRDAAANKEPHNKLRGMFAALGSFPFYCHESLGWKEDRDGYPGGASEVEQRLSILCSRPKLIAAGASAENIARETDQICRDLRVCGGWKASVAQLKAAGWFANRDVTMYRRFMGKSAARAMETFLTLADSKSRHWRDSLDPENPLAVLKTREQAKKQASKNLEQYVRFFYQEAKDSKIDISWLDH